MIPVDLLHLLRPAGGGVYSVSTGLAEQRALQRQIYRAARDEDVPQLHRAALEQIFSNLLDNAAKYLADGRPGRIEVRGKTRGGYAIFEIEDNGRGVAPADHERIFELFRRAGPQDRPGDGIGLAHTRALTRRLGGDIAVSSDGSSGTTFTVIIARDLGALLRSETT